jgi:hypothetical protein
MKFYYSLLFACLFFTSEATHLMGGDITILELPNGEHLVNLVAYRDTVGINMASYATFEFKGPNGLSFSRITAYDSVISGTVLPMYPYGVEIYFFSDTVSFPTAGEWHVSWKNCCRNGAIQNLSAPLSESMYLSTNIVIDSVSSNSTPFFLVPAAIYLPLNTPWQYNPLPFDPDGDSLVWSLDSPLNDSALYCLGYTAPPSAANNPLSLDSATGTISWTANTIGHFVISILVEQYRNGVWLGEIRRDMQLIVVPAGQGFPYWSAFNGQAPRDTISIDVPANSTLSFDIEASHSDTSQQLYMDAYSSLLRKGVSKASFSVSPTGVQNSIRGSFSFNPDSSHAGNRYIVVFRCSDQYFTNDQAVTINVTSGIGLEDLGAAERFGNWQLYPNPARDFINLSFVSEDQEKLNIEILDLEGRVLNALEADAHAGVNLLQLDQPDLQSGIYLVQVKAEDGLLWTTKMIKQ